MKLAVCRAGKAGPALGEHAAHPSKSSYLRMRKLPSAEVSFLLCSSLCVCVYIRHLFLPCTRAICTPEPEKEVLGQSHSVHRAEAMLQGRGQGTNSIHCSPHNHVASAHHASVHGRLFNDLALCMPVPWGQRRDSGPSLGQTKLTPAARANTQPGGQ